MQRVEKRKPVLTSLFSKFKKHSLLRRSQFEKEAFFLLVLGLSIFYITALASFTPLDDSAFSTNFPPMATANLAGVTGAYLAGFFGYYIGVVALVLPIPLISMALFLVLGHRRPFGFMRMLGWVALFFVLLMFISRDVPEVSVNGYELASGGVLGVWLSQLSVLYLGKVGTQIICATAIVCAVILITRIALVSPVIRLVKKTLAWLCRPMARAITRWRGRGLVKATQPSPTKPEALAESALRSGEPEFFITDQRQRPNGELYAPKPAIDLMHDPVIGLPEAEGQRTNHLSATDHELEMADDAPSPQKTQKEQYVPPSATIFKTSSALGPITGEQKREFERTAEGLISAFADFGIKGKVVAIQPGPVVTVYEFQHNAGTKLSKMMALIDDIALALKVDSIFIHPVSGKRVVGVQVPNTLRDIVYFGDVVNSDAFKNSPSPLTFVIGKTIKGDAFCADLTSMPHLLAAGQTGSGKSVAINSLLCSVIMKATPDEVKMILVDPKILELKVYEGIPHLLMPVITEPEKASAALKWATEEMDRRYRLMESARVRYIGGFNSFWDKATPEEREEILALHGLPHLARLSYILIVIDEMADLMMTASRDVENSIQRLAQKARACGIHLVLATQRPSVDVITGVIKANLPSRIAFKVFSRGDSRTILDSIGAEKLLGKGDMLYLKPGVSKLERIQGAFLEDEEVVNLIEAVKRGSAPQYDEQAMNWIEDSMQKQALGGKDKSALDLDDMDEDPKWDEAISVAQRYGAISASFLQRQLKIGYNRAARVVETMEKQGLVSHADGSKPRRWLGPGQPSP